MRILILLMVFTFSSCGLLFDNDDWQSNPIPNSLPKKQNKNTTAPKQPTTVNNTNNNQNNNNQNNNNQNNNNQNNNNQNNNNQNTTSTMGNTAKKHPSGYATITNKKNHLIDIAKKGVENCFECHDAGINTEGETLTEIKNNASFCIKCHQTDGKNED